MFLRVFESLWYLLHSSNHEETKTQGIGRRWYETTHRHGAAAPCMHSVDPCRTNRSRFVGRGLGHIMTRWAEKVSPDNAWREYPRPRMQRGENSWVNLNGLWDWPD